MSKSRHSCTIYSETSQCNIIESAEHHRSMKLGCYPKLSPKFIIIGPLEGCTFTEYIENGFLLAAFVVMERAEAPCISTVESLLEALGTWSKACK